ncbi:MAG: hypothetical protein O7A98_02625, partial [Acidobacteria bacterium]|nr:hypothetical protein [Acidobacteriota bacterium]
MILGADFDFGGPPEVTLGDLAPLTILGIPTDIEILAALPAGLPAGDYLLTVSTGPAPGHLLQVEYDDVALQDMNENNDQAAINRLGAFINAVEAQRGNQISNPDADALTAAAQAIIDLISAS